MLAAGSVSPVVFFLPAIPVVRRANDRVGGIRERSMARTGSGGAVAIPDLRGTVSMLRNMALDAVEGVG